MTGAAQEISWQELVNRKAFHEVIRQADSLTTADSASYTTMYAIGQAYEGTLRYPKAYAYYTHCLAMDTTNVEILNTLARIATNLGKASEAEGFFRQVLASDSTNFYANYQLGRLYQQLGEYELAIERYRFLQEEESPNPVLLRHIGDCYLRMEEVQGAALSYFQAYNHNRENASLAGALINTILRMSPEDANDALAICDTALYYNPDNKQLLQNKGMALYMNKRYLEADTLYSQLMEAGDSTFLTVKYAGVSRYYAGKYMDAIEPLELTYTRDTTAADICLLLGSALGKTYDRKRAYTLLDQAEENMRPDPFLVRQLLRFRAETYRKDGNIEMSNKLIYQGWKEDPQNLDLLSLLIATSYNQPHIEFLNKDEKIRQKTIYLRVLYMRESIRAGQVKPSFHYHRYFLESLYNDMFFRGVTEEPMLSPEGKRSTIQAHELRQLIDQLPEVPEEILKDRENEREMRRQIVENERKREEEKRVKGTLP